MESELFPARLNYVSRSGGPSWIQEGWIRPRSSLMALSNGGDARLTPPEPVRTFRANNLSGWRTGRGW